MGQAQVDLYNQCARFWEEMYCSFEHAAEIMESDRKKILTQFWGAHLRFFNNLLMAVKVEAIIKVSLRCHHPRDATAHPPEMPSPQPPEMPPPLNCHCLSCQ